MGNCCKSEIAKEEVKTEQYPTSSKFVVLNDDNTEDNSKHQSQLTIDFEKLCQMVKNRDDPNYIRHCLQPPIGELCLDQPQMNQDLVEEAIQTAGQFGFKNFDTSLPVFGPIQIGLVIYLGQWWNRERHGYGRQLWPDGQFYEGSWVNDHMDGHGRMVYADGDVYEGRFEQDKKSGVGTLWNKKIGSKYIGEWVDDLQEGQGRETWMDGAFYEGSYEKGEKHGRGRFCWSDGSIYQGDFNCSVIHGEGTYEWADGRIYKGQWKKNQMDGEGVFIWSDGRKYVGQYKNDKKHGYKIWKDIRIGEFEWPEGKKYRGQWAHGRQHGKGVIITSNGVAREGEWVDGKRINWTTDIRQLA